MLKLLKTLYTIMFMPSRWRVTCPLAPQDTRPVLAVGDEKMIYWKSETARRWYSNPSRQPMPPPQGEYPRFAAIPLRRIPRIRSITACPESAPYRRHPSYAQVFASFLILIPVLNQRARARSGRSRACSAATKRSIRTSELPHYIESEISKRCMGHCLKTSKRCI